MKLIYQTLLAALLGEMNYMSKNFLLLEIISSLYSVNALQ